jgi:sulfite oxidase
MTPFGKHSEITVHEREPFNAESPLGLLRRSFITPKGLYFSSNLGSIPAVDPDSYRLSVGGLVDRELDLSMEELRGFPSREVTAVLECALALDSSAGTQPATAEEVWNFKGYANNSWHGVRVAAR